MKKIWIVCTVLFTMTVSACSGAPVKPIVADLSELKSKIQEASGCTSFETLKVVFDEEIPARTPESYQYQLASPFIETEMVFGDGGTWAGDVYKHGAIKPTFDVCNTKGLPLKKVDSFETSPLSTGVDFEIVNDCADGIGDVSFNGKCSKEFQKAANYGFWWVIGEAETVADAKKWVADNSLTDTPKFSFGTYVVSVVAPWTYLNPSKVDLAFLTLLSSDSKNALNETFVVDSREIGSSAKSFTSYVADSNELFAKFCSLQPEDLVCMFFPDELFR